MKISKHTDKRSGKIKVFFQTSRILLKEFPGLWRTYRPLFKKMIWGVILSPFLTLSVAFAKILSYIMASFNIGYVKCRKNDIFMPTVYLSHPKTGRSIVLIGVMHIGSEAYYKRIEDTLLNLESQKYAVLYEKVLKLEDEEEPKVLNAQQIEIHEFLQSLLKDRPTIASALRIKEQKEALQYSKSAIRTDTTMMHLIDRLLERKISLKRLREQEKEMRSFFDSPDEIMRDFFKLLMMLQMNLFLGACSGISVLSNLITPFFRTFRILESVVLKERNIIALKAIYFHALDTDVVSIWGAAHLPGMIKDLKKQGYRIDKKEWDLIYTINNDFAKEFYQKHGKEMEDFRNGTWEEKKS